MTTYAGNAVVQAADSTTFWITDQLVKQAADGSAGPRTQIVAAMAFTPQPSLAHPAIPTATSHWPTPKLTNSTVQRCAEQHVQHCTVTVQHAFVQRRLQDQDKLNRCRLDFAGDRSVAWRVFRCAASLLADSHVARALAVATSLSQLQAVVQQHGPTYPHLQRLADAVLVHVDTQQVMLLLLKGLDFLFVCFQCAGQC